MNKPLELSNLMFLDPGFNEYVLRVQQAHSKPFSSAWRLNELAHKAMLEAKIARDDLQQVLLASLEHRALTSYQAVVLLLERGLPAEAQVVLRTLLEVTFRIVAISKDKEVGTAYAREDELHRRKYINKYRLLGDDVRIRTSEAEMNELKAVIDKKIEDLAIKSLSTQWFAQRAGMEDFYHSAYSVLSGSVHVNSRTLESALNLGENEELVSLKYGPSDEDLDDLIYTAIEALCLSLRGVHAVIDTEFAGEIEQLHEELKREHAAT